MAQVLRGWKVLLGLTGGIAAYKTALLCRLLRREGAEVRVLMTEMAKRFISPLTMATLSGHPVLVEMYDPTNGAWNSHVELGAWAEVFVIAPCTANTLGKLATGLADNLLTTTYLAARCPVLIAPAMDVDMYQHPSVQKNLQLLASRDRIVEPGTGFLASGLEGKGRMAEPEEILSSIRDQFAFSSGCLRGKRILVTSGPTMEPLDPVRYLTNRSSGLMGTCICDALADLGAKVVCVSGRARHIPRPRPNLEVRLVETAAQMHALCLELWPSAQAGIMVAAVADYRPESLSTSKIPHGAEAMNLRLARTEDIAQALGSTKAPGQILVGFALETDRGLESAQEKIRRKGLDLCVLNSLQDPGAGFETETNMVTLVYPDGRAERRNRESKQELAAFLAGMLAQKLEEAPCAG